MKFISRSASLSSVGSLLISRRSLAFTPFTSAITGTLSQLGPKVGATAQVSHSFSSEAVKIFADICGDNNPIHIDKEAGEKSIFKGNVVHGILVSSLFSTLLGRSIHGAVYVSQELNFKRPVYVGRPVTAKMEIINSEEKKKGSLLTCSTVCLLDDGSVAVEGQAKVLLPYGI
jgi:acyl dehydratase